MRTTAVWGCATALAAMISTGAAMAQDRATLIVFDASGSMWAQLEDGKSRIEIARDVIDEYAATRDAEEPVGVVAYGHNRRGDCGDIETVLPLGIHSGDTLASTIRGLNPQGMTPLTDSMAMARDMIPRTAESADIILITDGLENCEGDPCALAAEIAAEGIDIRAHVVGFALEEEAVQTLACVPEQTGGQLFTTQSGAELSAALTTVSAPAPVDLELHALDARDMSHVGSITWDLTTAAGEPVYQGTNRGIIHVELDPGEYVVEASDASFAGMSEFEVTPDTEGPIEVVMAKLLATVMVRGEHGESGETLEGVEWTVLDIASESAESFVNEGGGYYPLHLEPGEYRIEGEKGDLHGGALITATREEDQDLDVILEPAEREITVEIEAPEEVEVGASFEVVVTGSHSDDDYMLLAEVGSDEEVSRYGRMTNTVGGDGEKSFTAPATPGSYELRYYLREDRALVQRAAIEVVDAGAEMTAPEQVNINERFEVSLSAPGGGHLVLVSPERAEDDIVSRYDRIRNSVDAQDTVTRTAPSDPGTYELRFHMGDDHRLMARALVEVVDVEVTMSAPEQVTAEESFEIEIGGGVSGHVVIVDAERAEDDIVSRYDRIRNSVDGDEGTISRTAPEEPGTYELRYHSGGEHRLLASQPIEVVAGEEEPEAAEFEAGASLSAPDEAPAGAQIEVEWEGPDERRDYIVVVPAEAPADHSGHSSRAWSRTSSGNPVSVELPDALGTHEIRYIHNETDEILAVRTIELTPINAALIAPETAAAGDSIEVEWQGPDNRRDYITIVEPGAPEGDSGHSNRAWSRTSSGNPVSIEVPDALGTHEIRYVHGQNDRILASVEIEIEGVTASVSAPEEVAAGADFEVEWEGPDNRRDYIAIVEVGAPEGASGHNNRAWSRTSSGSPVTIEAPDALGEFEVRYVMDQTDRTLASQTITVTGVSASVSGPEEVPAGADFEVEWEGPDNRRDYIAIVPVGAPEGASGHNNRAWSRTSSGSPVSIEAPDALGEFEIRYVMDQTDRTLASQTITVTPVTATVEPSEPIVPGGEFEVHWEGPDNRRDYIAIVEVGAPEGASGHSNRAWSRTSSGSPVTLTAPDEEGEYEVRYVMDQSDRTLASVTVNVGAGDVSLSIAEPVTAGGVVTVEWTGPGRFEDFIEIVEAGAADDADAIRDARASQGSPLQLFAPSSAGTYELRYRASDSGEVLARIELEVGS